MKKSKPEPIPVMDYRQYRRARRLVHECCNYDGGNCIALDDGEECVCVQSISYSLLCRWFRAAVLPLDRELETALFHRLDAKRCAVCGALFTPGSNRAKYCPECAGRMERIKRRKAQGLQDRYLYDYTFANDNGQNPLMDKARAYVENWKEAYKNNTGLLLFGDVGTGKSFFAGCIANALLDRDVPVLMTNFPTILNRLTGMFSEDRADFIASFDEYDLLIIDDLGVERSTEYAMEQMFFVIDSRYRSRRPMIITTNLKLAELKNPPDLAHARIYDRILERCAPILFAGKNFREENAGATKQAAKDIVNRKHE